MPSALNERVGAALFGELCLIIVYRTIQFETSMSSHTAWYHNRDSRERSILLQPVRLYEGHCKSQSSGTLERC